MFKSFKQIFQRRNIFYALFITFFLESYPSFASTQINLDVDQLDEKQKVIINSDIQIKDANTGVVTAMGNVEITYPLAGIRTSSLQAQYYSKEAILVLTGDVSFINKSGDSITADRLVYLIDRNQLVADSKAKSYVFTRLILENNLSLLDSFSR